MTGYLALLAAVSSFNLNCTAKSTFSTWVGMKMTPISESQVATTLRIDLDQKLWCSGDCTHTSPIDEVSDDAIVFYRDDTQKGKADFSVNRRTGELTNNEITYTPNGMLAALIKGVCKPTAFTEFPPRKF